MLAPAGIALETCDDLDGLLQELVRGGAAILIPEEAIDTPPAARLLAMLAHQPAWSDLPVLLLGRVEGARASDAARAFGNVTMLHRPLRSGAVLGAVRGAMRARGRQLRVRGHFAERAETEASLRQADQRKDEFLATLGHELRNPLAPLLTSLQLLRTAGFDGPHVSRVLAVMERQVDHLVRLVDDLLEVSRITRGLVRIRREPVDLTTVLRSAVETSRPIVEAQGHELTIDLPAEHLTLIGDALRLTQVFANLLTNAAKYTNPGGHIWLTVTPAAGFVRVCVRDNGIGIPPAHLATVFDMFVQVDRESRRAQGGLGIGLTLARSLIEMHGGQVEARSAGAGAGSEFIVTLPLQHVAAGLPVLALLPAFSSWRILIVDDNGDAADMLAALLTSLGAGTATAHSGAQALDVAASFKPDAVLLDIGMPGMDGYQVARRIRASLATRDVVLVALTGWGQAQDQRLAREAVFDHHLVKPPDIARLRAMLDDGRRGPRPADTTAPPDAGPVAS
jgi:signal transduction histidine kinase/CheY-like chemotaxis protein